MSCVSDIKEISNVIKSLSISEENYNKLLHISEKIDELSEEIRKKYQEYNIKTEEEQWEDSEGFYYYNHAEEMLIELNVYRNLVSDLIKNYELEEGIER